MVDNSSGQGMESLPNGHGKGAFYASVLLTVLPFLCVGLFSGDDFLIRFFPDDAFYYIQTAWNFSETGKISFDGINWTNGFHPLFFIVSSVVARLFPKDLLLNVFFLLNVFLVFSALVLCLQKFETFLDNQLKSLAFQFFSMPLFFCFVWISCGMETGLVVLASALFFLAWIKADRHDFTHRSQNLRLGAAVSFIMLSRLELVFVLIPFYVFICYRLFRKNNGDGLKHACEVFILPLLIGGFYLGINVIFTGHAIPISGIAKKLHWKPFWKSWKSSTGGSVTVSIVACIPLLVSLTVFVGACFRRLRKPFSPARLHDLLLLNVGVVLYYLYLFFFAWHFFIWYFAFPSAAFLISGLLMAGTFGKAGDLLRTHRRFGVRVVVFGLLVNVAANTYFLLDLVPRNTNASYHLLKIAREVDRLCGPEAVIATFDAGIVGFFTAGRVINLDGLANNFDYLENYYVPRRFQEYFQQQGVTYFLARDFVLSNKNEVKKGDYVSSTLWRDRRIELFSENELFRYSIPRNFSVYLFRL